MNQAENQLQGEHREIKWLPTLDAERRQETKGTGTKLLILLSFGIFLSVIRTGNKFFLEECEVHVVQI